MKIVENKIYVGIEKPFKVMHISDSHLTLADERDNERKRKLAVGRGDYFINNNELLAEQLAYAKNNQLPILHTGDLLDFVSEANIDKAKEISTQYDFFMAAGNHEFSQYVGEAWEDRAYKEQTLEHVQTGFQNDIEFSTKMIGGVKFIAIDNGYYLFYPEHVEQLMKETSGPEPVILLMHNPLYEDLLYRREMDLHPCAYLTGVPEELMKEYEEYRYRQQKADASTLQAIDYISHCQQIKAVLAGHLHNDFEDVLYKRIPQYVSGIGTTRIIEIL